MFSSCLSTENENTWPRPSRPSRPSSQNLWSYPPGYPIYDPLCFRLQQPRCWNLKPQGQWTDGRIKCYRLQQKVMFKIFIPDINTTFLSTWHENHWKHVISSDPQSSPHPQVLAATIRRKKTSTPKNCDLWLVGFCQVWLLQEWFTKISPLLLQVFHNLSMCYVCMTTILADLQEEPRCNGAVQAKTKK